MRKPIDRFAIGIMLLLCSVWGLQQVAIKAIALDVSPALIEHFVAGSTARAAGEIVGVQANTSARFYIRLQHLIVSKLPSYELSG